MRVVTLYRAVGAEEFKLIETSGRKRYPARLPPQPIFYPVVREEYARKIAKEWNVRAGGAGYVTRFLVDAEYLTQFEVHEVGGRENAEYWIPAERLEDFNEHIIGLIEVIAKYRA